MIKVVSSIFGESEQVKVFKVFNKICNNFVTVKAYQNEQIVSLLPSEISYT